MYLKVSDNVTDEQLEAIAKILQVPEVEYFYNVHYEACKFEIECAMENMFRIEDFKKLQAQPEYYEKINELSNIFYDKSFYQWDCLYENAEEIVNDYMKELLDSID